MKTLSYKQELDICNTNKAAADYIEILLAQLPADTLAVSMKTRSGSKHVTVNCLKHFIKRLKK